MPFSLNKDYIQRCILLIRNLTKANYYIDEERWLIISPLTAFFNKKMMWIGNITEEDNTFYRGNVIGVFDLDTGEREESPAERFSVMKGCGENVPFGMEIRKTEDILNEWI